MNKQLTKVIKRLVSMLFTNLKIRPSQNGGFVTSIARRDESDAVPTQDSDAWRPSKKHALKVECYNT